MRTGILQNENILRINLKALIVNSRCKVVQRRKYNHATFMLEQAGVCGRALEDRTLRRQISEQSYQAAFGLQWIFCVRK